MVSVYETEGGYSYAFSQAATIKGKVDEDTSKKEIQNFINTTLGLLTAGCEQCIYSQMLFCEKQKRQVKVRDSRCEYFMRRPTTFLQDLV